MAEPLFDMNVNEVKRVPRIMRIIEANGGRVEKPLKRFNVHMNREIDRTFRDGGRGDVHWPPLAEVTMIMRQYRKKGKKRTNPKRMLQDTGHLKSSIKDEVKKDVDGAHFRVWTDTPYAKTHQEGGKITIPEKTIRPKRKWSKKNPKRRASLHFVIDGEDVFVQKVVIKEHTKDVPKRPFLFFLPTDVERSVELLLEHAREVTGKAARAKA